MLAGLSPARRANSGGIMQIINKLWMVLLVGGFALAGCGAGTDSGAGGFAVQGVDIADCVANPFDTACDSAEFDDAKQYRLAFCSLAENAEHVRCADLPANINTGVTLETQNPTPQDTVLSLHRCESTPFSPNCGATYETARQTRADFCATADNATAPQCRGAIVSNPCILDPTRPDCGADYADNRKQRMAFCTKHSNAQNPICASILSRPTFATWVQSFETAPFTHVSKARAGDENRSEFLQITANGLNIGDSVGIARDDDTIDGYSVRGGGAAFAKDGGVSGFSSVKFNTFHDTIRAYAGILSGTDLGAPLAVPESSPDGSAIAVWRGVLYSSYLQSNRFKVSIDLANKSIYAVDKFSYFSTYIVNGTFNDHGVITGSFAYTYGTRNSPGILTGLIGDGGLIGAFISSEDAYFGYSGGFAASPPDQLKEFCDANNNADKIVCAKIINDSFCNYDPFGAGCGREYASERKARINLCIISGNVSLGLCGGATLAYPCVANPFGADCGADYDFARTQRYNYCYGRAKWQEDACFHFIDNFCKYGGNARVSICGGAVRGNRCVGNPFIGTCGTDWESARSLRIDFCIIGDNVNLPICDGADFHRSCIRNPYGFCADKYAQARTNRYDFCMTEGNATASLCDTFTRDFCAFGGNASDTLCDEIITSEPCIANPFAGGCGNYVVQRATRRDWCTQGANVSSVLCADDACLQDPFAESCNIGTYSYARKNRAEFCASEEGKDAALCEWLIAQVSGAFWAHSLDIHPDRGAKATDTGNKIFLGQFNGLDIGNLRDETGRKIDYYLLGIGNDFYGLAAGGVGFFQFTPQDIAGRDKTRYYAALFSGTNLGAPLTPPVQGAAVRAIWAGVLGSTTHFGDRLDINFDVDFTNRTFGGTVVKNTVKNKARYTIDTTFNAGGFLQGTVALDLDSVISTGVVTGLIGELGAVGAFISDAGVAAGYSGGFIAEPPSKDYCWQKNHATMPACRAIVAQDACVGNPYGAKCGSDFDSARGYRTRFCLLPANLQTEFCTPAITDFCTRDGNATSDTCEAAVATTPCIGDPFGSACGYRFNTARDNRFAFCSIGDNVNLPICKSAYDDNHCLRFPYEDCYSHFDITRAERYDFCIIEANAGNPLCTDFAFKFCTDGNNVRLAFCAEAVANDSCLSNPFQSGCGNNYYTARLNRVAWCTQGTNATDALCSVNACARNPFGQGCRVYYKARINRLNFCTQAVNKNHTFCEVVLATPTSALWAHSLDTHPASAPSRADTGNKFLLGGENYLDAGDLFPDERFPEVWSSSSINVEGGFFTDGYGYFQYTPPDGETRYYAGLVSTAIGGAPLELPAEGEALSAIWAGFFDSTYSGYKIPIEFDVNFADRTFVGNATKDTGRYIFDATFNAAGFLQGTVNLELDSVTSAGVVTGLIGEGGAIGAFISNAGVAQGYSGGFLAEPETKFTCSFFDNALKPICRHIVVEDACIGNPYGAECGGDFRVERERRWSFCQKPANRQTEFCAPAIIAICTATPFASPCDARFDDLRRDFCRADNNATSNTCTATVAKTPCIGNPFGVGCGSDFDILRANRKAFCTPSVNLTNPICADFTSKFCGYGNNANHSYCDDAVAADPCVSLPFHYTCGAGYTKARELRIDWCARGANALDDVCASSACSINPFGQGCSLDAYASTRTERIGFCATAGNQNHSLCAEVNARVTSARWTRSLDTHPATTASVADTGNRFLLGTQDGLNVGDLRDARRAPPTVHTLNLRNGAGGADLAGSKPSDSGNGVGFFQYTPADGATRYYAGLFSGVNLGAPLVKPDVELNAEVTWQGWLHATNMESPSPINFRVDLFNRTLTVDHPPELDAYVFNAEFDAQGIITGSVRYFARASETPGIVHGLIGQTGAIGVFVSDVVGSRYGFAGGFIARPPSE